MLIKIVKPQDGTDDRDYFATSVQSYRVRQLHYKNEEEYRKILHDVFEFHVPYSLPEEDENFGKNVNPSGELCIIDGFDPERIPIVFSDAVVYITNENGKTIDSFIVR